MTLHDFLAAARKHWVWVLMPIVVLGGAIGYLSMQATPIYRATSSVYVTMRASGSATDLNQGASYTQAQMLSFARLATLPVVLQPVVDDLGLDRTAKSLANSVTVTTPKDTSILDVAATGSSPQRTADVANAVAEEMTTVITSLAPTDESGHVTIRATVVNEAQPATYPISPNTKRNVIAAVFAGLVLGLIAAYLREVLDTRVRRAQDVEATVDTPVLGTLRSVRRAAQVNAFDAVAASSPQAEEFRRIRTNLQMIGKVGRPKVFVFSSALAGEGKSYVSLRVAASFAAAGDRVLVIDADLRRPAVAAQLGIEGGVGLTEVLVGRATFDEVAQPIGANLVVLASGAIPPNPSELLSSREFEDLLELAHSRFDTIIVDAPPLLPVADAVVISRVVTGLILVLDASRVRRAQVRRAVEIVRLGGGRVVGAVLNRAKVAAESVYSYETIETGRRRRRPAGHVAPAGAPAPPRAPGPVSPASPASPVSPVSPASPVSSEAEPAEPDAEVDAAPADVDEPKAPAHEDLAPLPVAPETTDATDGVDDGAPTALTDPDAEEEVAAPHSDAADAARSEAGSLDEEASVIVREARGEQVRAT